MTSKDSPSADVPAEIWVSPAGDDGAPGAAAAPLRTLRRAHETLCGLAAEAAGREITIWIADGTYRLDAPLVFDPALFGPDGLRVRFRAAPGAKPVISGAVRVTGWTLHDEALNIYKAHVGGHRSRQLYVDGRRATRARTTSNPPGFRPNPILPLQEGGGDPRYVIGGGIEFLPIALNPHRWRDPAQWKNPRAVEAVIETQWKMMRVPLQEVLPSSTTRNGVLATTGMWGEYTTPTPNSGNRIVHNHISRFLMDRWDGGAIYSTGRQGSSMDDPLLVEGNVACGKRVAAGGNTFYSDGGSRYIVFRNNASFDNPIGHVDLGPPPQPGDPLPYPPGPSSLNVVPYGSDTGGCRTYGDIHYENNYWMAGLIPQQELAIDLLELLVSSPRHQCAPPVYTAQGYFNVCPYNEGGVDYPTGLRYTNNHDIPLGVIEVPAAILHNAGVRDAVPAAPPSGASFPPADPGPSWNVPRVSLPGLFGMQPQYAQTPVRSKALYLGDWMAIVLDDGLTLVLAAFWQPWTPQWITGTKVDKPPRHGFGNLYFKPGGGAPPMNGGIGLRPRTAHSGDDWDFDVNILEPEAPERSPSWTSPFTTTTYATAWQIDFSPRVAAHHVRPTLYVYAVSDNCEIAVCKSGAFYEGAAVVYADKERCFPLGHAFVEQMGFDQWVPSRS